MIDDVITQTNLYIDSMSKTERKKYGQFFTSKETALFMASLYSVPDNMETLAILDAGAGSGILACAIVEVLQKKENLRRIELTCYENDRNILDVLYKNLEYIKSNSFVELEYEVITDNYIISQKFKYNGEYWASSNSKKYDFVIGNPPYMKISKDAPEAIALPMVCYGAPNLYFLFASMGVLNLKEEGELIYIIPRSWTSGAYFKQFREFFLSESKLEYIHLFVSRNKVFDKEDVLQETMIVKVKKTRKIGRDVIITSSQSSNDFNQITKIVVPYDIVVSGSDNYVYLVTKEEDIEVLKKLNHWTNTLPSIGLKMKTGLTVDFRNRDILRNEAEEGTIPLFYSQHIRDGLVIFPINREYEYVVTEQKGLLQRNKNYLFVKRFTAKEEKRRLQCGIYLSKRYPDYEMISTQNKINFIDGISCELSERVVYGLYVLFNSSLYDSYYRILNGSTQVNATEINAMPVPDICVIQEFGKKLIKTEDLTEENCNKILGEHYI